MNVESGDDESAREVSDGTDEDEAAEEALHKFIREYDWEEFIRQKTKKRRVVVSNLWKSGWGLMLRHPNIQNPNSREAKIFRRRFRVPYILFRDILVPLCKNKQIFGVESYRNKIPVEFKILSSLRILARGVSVDDITESTNISESWLNKCFKLFVKNIALHLKDEIIYFPENEELKETMRYYSKLGFPLAVGEMDCTHIYWNKCPQSLLNICTGKEKTPSIVFEVVGGPNRRIFHVSEAFFGSFNDKTICSNDSFPKQLGQGKLKDCVGIMYDENNVPRVIKGGYIITDNGYNQSPYFVFPIKTPLTYKDTIFSEWIESTRKNIECIFGILKNRFRFLKNYVEYHDICVIADAFTTGCILHNMLLTFDSAYEQFDWETNDPFINEECEIDSEENNVLTPIPDVEEVAPLINWQKEEELIHKLPVYDTIDYRSTADHDKLKRLLIIIDPRYLWATHYQNLE